MHDYSKLFLNALMIVKLYVTMHILEKRKGKDRKIYLRKLYLFLVQLKQTVFC